MNISKNSWHYRFITESFVGSESITRVPDSLCPYMRRLAVVFIMSIFFYSLVIGALYLVVNFIGLSVLIGMYGFVHPGSGVLGISFLFVCGSLLGAFIVLVLETIRRLFNKARNKVESTPDNIFIEYAKSVHNKFCPKIEFKD